MTFNNNDSMELLLKKDDLLQVVRNFLENKPDHPSYDHISCERISNLSEEYRRCKEEYDPVYADLQSSKQSQGSCSFNELPGEAQAAAFVGCLLFPITLPAFGIYSLIEHIKEKKTIKRKEKLEEKITNQYYEDSNKAGFSTTKEEIRQSRAIQLFPSKQAVWYQINDALKLMLFEPERINGYTAWMTSQYCDQNIPQVDIIAKKILEIYNSKN